MSTDRDRSPIDRKRRRKDTAASAECKVFVTNFPFDVKWPELKDLFREKVGDIAHVELFKDESGKPRGCGIVEFSNAEFAQEAIRKLDRVEWKGRKLSVKEAADAERDQYGRIIKPGSGGDRGRSQRHERRVYVSNLPYDMKWQDVKDLFRDKVGETPFVELFDDEDGKPRGCGLLEFDSKDLASKAIKLLHRTEIRGRKISVQEAGDFERDKHGYIVKDGKGGRSRDERSRDSSSRLRQHSPNRGGSGSSIGGGGGGGGGYGYTYGLSIDFLQSLGIDGALHTKIFIGNLSYEVDNDKLKEVFRLAGRIVHAEVIKDRDGKSRGYGVVEYTHPVEAVQAISMLNGQKLFDRPLGVRFDREPVQEERLPRLLPEGLENVGMGLGSGGKPLTNVLKTLEQAKDNTPATNNGAGGAFGGGGAVGNSFDSVKALAELTPALAVLAQQINMAQTGGVGAGGGGGGGLGGGFGVGRAMSPPPAPKPAPVPAMLGSGPSGLYGGHSGYSTMHQQQQQQHNSMQSGMGGGMTGSMGGMSSRYDSLGPDGDGYGNYAGSMGSMNRGGSGMSDHGAGSNSTRPSGDLVRRDPFSSAGPTSGGGMNSMAAPDVAPQVFDTIIVRNLPHDLDWKALGEFFSTCGDVKNVMIKEKGIGLVRFTTQRAAERALNYDSTTKWGRMLDVRIY